VPENDPPVKMVSVKQYDVNFTWDQILGSLEAPSAVSATAHPELPALLSKVSDLVSQLKDTVTQVNQIDPTVLKKAAPPASSA